ncbi:MAG TPA: PH domain-containing protein [Lacisediminihabitans sp.]|uniref:PH domain-containing protein n=1 Tax=Lacisediminihabitans sp. TaxID=2787631 RepID=UPI002ED8C8C4
MTIEAQDTERVVARLRPHGRVLFWPSVVLIAAALALGYFAGSFNEEWENIALVAGAALVILLLWLLPLLAWLGKRYTITTRRIIIRTGFFVRIRQELLHSRGYDVTVRQNGLQSLFRSGTVLINTGLEQPVVLHDVPGADLVQSALHDLMENSLNPIAARRQAAASQQSDDTTIWGTR